MLLILGFAESSNDSESIFRSRDSEAPKRKRPRGARMRLRTFDWEASVKAQVHRPQPKARSPREYHTREYQR